MLIRPQSSIRTDVLNVCFHENNCNTKEPNPGWAAEGEVQSPSSFLPHPFSWALPLVLVEAEPPVRLPLVQAALALLVHPPPSPPQPWRFDGYVALVPRSRLGAYAR